MNQLYQRTFDHVRMPEDRARSLRAALASRCSSTETEVISMKKQTMLRRPTLLVAAALLIAALSLSALACGSRVIYRILSDKNDVPAFPENSTTYDLTGQEFDTGLPYTYTEEDGEIQVFLPEDGWAESN